MPVIEKIKEARLSWMRENSGKMPKSVTISYGTKEQLIEEAKRWKGEKFYKSHIEGFDSIFGLHLFADMELSDDEIIIE